MGVGVGAGAGAGVELMLPPPPPHPASIIASAPAIAALRPRTINRPPEAEPHAHVQNQMVSQYLPHNPFEVTKPAGQRSRRSAYSRQLKKRLRRWIETGASAVDLLGDLLA